MTVMRPRDIIAMVEFLDVESPGAVEELAPAGLSNMTRGELTALSVLAFGLGWER